MSEQLEHHQQRVSVQQESEKCAGGYQEIIMQEKRLTGREWDALTGKAFHR